MIRLRLAALVAGVGALITCVPALSRPIPEPVEESQATAEPARTGMPLLLAAARAARSQAWRATQRVVVLGSPEEQVQLEHVPGEGSAVLAANGTRVVAEDVLDASLLTLLARNYQVRLAGTAACAGRATRVVEAVRPGVYGAGAVAARFWLDTATGLLMRRDVHDHDGSLLRSVEVLRLAVLPAVATLPAEQKGERPGEVLRPRGQRLLPTALSLLGAQGWPVPEALPRGFDLYDARLLDGDVLQLAYSDGLSTTSVFVQRGALPPGTSGLLRTLDGASVWVSDGAPGRMVWAAGGLTFTLVSDASADARDAAVLALPHVSGGVLEDGVVPRVWRGMARVGSWLNPFE